MSLFALNISKISLLSLFWILPTHAAPAEKPYEWALHIDTRLDLVYFPEENGDTNQFLTKLELDPNFRLKYLDSWRLFIKPTFVANPDNFSTEEQYFLDPTEAYLKYQGDTLSWQLGYNTFTWGVTDGYNPLDIVSSKQYFDPLHSRKLGAPSLAISQTLPWFDWDFAYIVQNRGATMPGEESRWLPREVYIPLDPANDLVLLLPSELRYHYNDRQNLDHALDNNLALRIQKHFTSIDIGLYGYSGVATFPLVQPIVTGTVVAVSPKTVIQVDPDIYLNTKNYPVHQGGFSFVSSQYDFLLKYATSYTQTIGDDPLLLGWTHENIVALEKTFQFTDGILIGVLQYSFLNTEKTNDSNLSLLEIFRNAWMLGGKMTWKEVWNFSFTGLYNSTTESHYEELILGRRFLDRWTVSFAANIISGEIQNPLGVYNKNDNYQLSLSASF